MDLGEVVDRLTRVGLEVMGGFIVGFDSDTAEVFEAQRTFLSRTPIPLAMVGMLTALPGTQLSRRLEREGRLRTQSTGDQFGRPNFEPSMNERTLLNGYANLMRDLYTADSYYDRCEAYLDRATAPLGRRRIEVRDLLTVLRTSLKVGLIGSGRKRYWRLLVRAFRRTPRFVPWAIVKGIMGEHMIQYTAGCAPTIGASDRGPHRSHAKSRGPSHRPRSPHSTLAAEWRGSLSWDRAVVLL
ncbi:MAG: DUF4070 domain-containing protein [Deltaproteobacteria bacterium]|nr:DUF4070 domain-containing protein [Deltaproteobacteria bacterium]